MQIPFYRPSLTDAEIHAVLECLHSGWLTTGPRAKQFEQEFSDFIGQKHSVALNSCTAALHLALEAIGLKAGETVVVPTMTFAATAEVVGYFNATPLLVDCREDDFNLDLADTERRIEATVARGLKVAAILPVHYGGQIGDVVGVQRLARRFDLKVIEDAAHCCPAYFRESESERANGGGRKAEAKSESGARKAEEGNHAHDAARSRLDYAAQGWRPVGATADITCFSFYANKCITTGEGGMACTTNDGYAERMRIMSLHGISKDAWKRFTSAGSWYYEIIAPGYKYNLTDIAAAMGIQQLRRADAMHRQRAQWAELYSELLGQVDELILPTQQPDRIHSWHLYAIRLKLDQLGLTRAEVIDALKAKGITTSVHWLPLHLHPYYRARFGYQPNDLPMAARLYPELITLPLFPDMTEGEVRYVCDTLKGIIAASRRTECGVDFAAAK